MATKIVRRNKCTNPNFEANSIAGWATFGGFGSFVPSATAPFSGTFRGSAIGNNTSGSPRINMTLANSGIQSGEQWTLQWKLKEIGTWPSGGTVWTALRWQVYPSGEVVQSAPAIAYAPDADGWMRSYITGICPPNFNGTVWLNLGVINLSANLQATGELGVDEICFEPGSLSAYFAGNTPAAGGISYAYTGTAHLSESIGTVPMGTSKNDDLFTSLAPSYSSPPAFSSIADMERRRLLAALALSEPQKLSLYDLYKMNGERPRI